jgi:predicted permease
MALMIAEALVPIFFVMFLGYFAGARRIIDNHHVASLNVLEARGKAAGSSPHPIATALFRSVCKPVVIAPVAGLVVALLGIQLDEVVSHALNLIGATAAGLACFVTGLVLSAQPLQLNANVGVGVLIKNIVLPLVAYAIALALGMSGEIAREAILLTAIPTGFFGILFGLNYGVRAQAIGSTLALSSLVSVITLTAAILLTSQMK